MPQKCHPEVMVREVRLVQDHLVTHGAVTATAAAIGRQLGISQNTARRWVATRPYPATVPMRTVVLGSRGTGWRRSRRVETLARQDQTGRQASVSSSARAEVSAGFSARDPDCSHTADVHAAAACAPRAASGTALPGGHVRRRPSRHAGPGRS